MAKKPLRVLVVDDEPLGRQRVEDLLRREPDVEMVGSAASGAVAIDAIRLHAPDLVFLDVQMPGKSGLDVVREIGADAMPATIFVTAYDQYALKAFDLAAVDYLVKPFDDERFEQAYRRARTLIELKQLGRLREQLLEVLQNERPSGSGGEQTRSAPSRYLERIAVEMRGKVRVVPVEEIHYITASGVYAEIHTADHRYVIRETMQSLEERLDPSRFLRIHRSAIVSVPLVETLHRGAGGDYEVQLKSGVRLPVSRARREELERRIGVAG